MRLTLKTPPTAPAVQESVVRAHLRIDSGVEDFLVLTYIRAATAYLDGWSGILGRALMPQAWTMTLPAFPAGSIDIPLGPVTSVVSVSYKDEAGVVNVLGPASYSAHVRSDGASICSLSGWPPVGSFPDAVTVEFIAGEGCPDPVQVAIMMMVASIFDGRSGAEMLTPAAEALIRPYRMVLI